MLFFVAAVRWKYQGCIEFIFSFVVECNVGDWGGDVVV